MKRFSLALSAGCAVSLMAGAALADPPAQVGRIAWVENGVSFLPPGEESWTWASVNFPVTSSESFWTGDTGRTELQVGPIEVSADNESELDVLALDYGQMRLGLPQGSIDLKLWQAPPGGAVISTPAGDVVIDQAGDYRVDVGAPQDDGSYPPVEVTVFDGHASAPGQYGPSDVWPGAAAVIYPGYDPQLQDAQDAAIDDWARWRQSTERWDVQANYSPAVTGYGELASYGDFVQDPSYGQVWYPSGVASDWAPYRYGRWAYVAPWGYTWVDDQPWGFAPFHYGRWAQINGRWGWIAGQPAVQPVYAPALVAFIGGVALGVGGGGGSVGWIPLGPDEVYRPPYQVSPTYLRQVNAASVSRTTINNITINNITTVTQYRNAGAAMVVPAGSFAGGEHVQRAAVAVAPGALAQARPAAAGFAAALPPPTAMAKAGGAAPMGGGGNRGPSVAPPARLQAVHAAVAAQPAGATRPPVIAGAHMAPPQARPPGAPAFVAPAQVHNPTAQAKQPVAAPNRPTGGPAAGSFGAQRPAPGAPQPGFRPAPRPNEGAPPPAQATPQPAYRPATRPSEGPPPSAPATMQTYRPAPRPAEGAPPPAYRPAQEPPAARPPVEAKPPTPPAATLEMREAPQPAPPTTRPPPPGAQPQKGAPPTAEKSDPNKRPPENRPPQ